VGTLSAGIEMAARNKRGEPALGVQVSMEPVHTGAVPLFNVSLDYERFLAVQLFPALLHILAMTAGAWAVGTHLRDRTLVDWLGTAPTRLDAVVAVTAKLAWPLVSLGLVGTLALLGITWARGWEPAGSVAWTVAALWVFLTLSIVMGALASAALRSLRMGLSATGFVTAPAFAFSGVGFPLLAMPEGARLWAKALPFTHFARVQTEQLLMGAPLRVSLATPLWMGIATALFFGALVWSLRSIAAQPQSWGKR
jgi:ABC-2 type transport system permease protein